MNLLSHEHNALYEIEQALERIKLGTYGTCEVSGKPIPHERLQAIPFARCTVDIQSRLERDKGPRRFSEPAKSLFALPSGESSEEENGEEGLPNGEN
jgi:DnaK suppressor protein